MSRAGLSLRVGLPLALLLYAVVAGLLTVALAVQRADQRTEDQYREQLVRQLHSLQGSLSVQLRNGAIEEAQRQVVDASVAPEIEFVVLLDEERSVVIASRHGWVGQEFSAVAPPLWEDLSLGPTVRAQRLLHVRHDTDVDRLVGQTWVALPNDSPTTPARASLLIVTSLRALRADERSIAVNAAAGYAGLMVVFALALAWALRRWLAHRIDTLSAAAAALAEGQLSARAGMTGGDEFALLGRSFDAMADRIAQSVRAERRLTAVLARSNDGVLLADESGHVVYANAAWTTLTGSSGDRLIGRSTDEALPKAARGKPDGLFHLEGIGGGEALVQFTTTSVFEGASEKGSTVFVLRDQTELSALEQQLLQAQKMEAVGQLAGGVAHDFNNLLTVILGNAQLLEVETSGVGARLVEEIVGASERAAEITKQLLAFSRQGPVVVETVSLDEIVATLRPLLRRLLPEDIELFFQLSDAPAISADRVQIEQVLVNLAVNARDAMPTGGRIDISVHELATPGNALPPAVLLRVADNGPGMSEETARRAFEPFYTTKDVDKGTGLGLAMVHGIVERFGGSIDLSTAPGEGCAIEMVFPNASQALPTPSAAPRLKVVPRNVATALVCEDSSAVRKLMVRQLANAGIDATGAATPAEALRLLTEAAFDVLVTDVVMPEMDGVSLARAVREAHPTVAVVFVSGYPRDHLTSRGVDDLAAIVLQKPFGRGGLARAVQQAIQRRPEVSANA